MDVLTKQQQEIVDISRRERDAANGLSDFRGQLARPLGVVTEICPNVPAARFMLGGALTGTWDTDREDGQLGRNSVSRLEDLCLESPEVAQHPQVKELLSEETKADGARRDADNDKALSNAITGSLLRRAAREENWFGVACLAATRVITGFRDPAMQRQREYGKSHGVDTKALSMGKLKTALRGTGETVAAGSTSKSTINNLGHMLIAASNVPSLIALVQMKRHISKELKKR